MKIGIDCREFTGNLTGISRVLFNFFKYVAENDIKHEFLLFGNNKTYFDYDFLKSGKFKIFRLKGNMFFLWDQVKQRRALERNSVDLFYSPYYKMPFYTKIPSIISLFDLTYFVVEPYSKRMFYNAYLKFYISRSVSKAKKIITCSEYSKRDIVNILGVDQRKIEVVYLGVSEKFVPAAEAGITALKNKYSIDRKYVLYTGNKSEHKNLRRLVKAFGLAQETLKNEYCLVLAGVDQSPTGSDISVKAIGHVHDNELPALYSGARLLVIPSLYEGFGLPALEAMACACPVISSDTSCMPEIFGGAPLYFNPFSALDIKNRILEVLGNANLAQEMKQRGIERASGFRVEHMAKRFLEVFEAAATAKG
ncbi:MAG: hypothetical protein A2293_08445 [Elusimicrobia bacterium RIFOXYB2_FULL_49_7]|nr:MAG: hypothetical protein A2293_08445 [Elusimicrobia bacterium RIFOXYB2_FULL_49_7]